jgi:hypothetical protein
MSSFLVHRNFQICFNILAFQVCRNLEHRAIPLLRGAGVCFLLEPRVLILIYKFFQDVYFLLPSSRAGFHFLSCHKK